MFVFVSGSGSWRSPCLLEPPNIFIFLKQRPIWVVSRSRCILSANLFTPSYCEMLSSSREVCTKPGKLFGIVDQISRFFDWKISRTWTLDSRPYSLARSSSGFIMVWTLRFHSSGKIRIVDRLANSEVTRRSWCLSSYWTMKNRRVLLGENGIQVEDESGLLWFIWDRDVSELLDRNRDIVGVQEI